MRQWDSLLPNHLICNLIYRHTNGNRIKTAADNLAYQIALWQNYCKRAWEKGINKCLRLRRDLFNQRNDVLFICNMNNKRIIARPALSLINIFDGVLIERIRTQAVNCFCRKRNKPAVCKDFARKGYILIIC